jgi:hypothetical protein
MRLIQIKILATFFLLISCNNSFAQNKINANIQEIKAVQSRKRMKNQKLC